MELVVINHKISGPLDWMCPVMWTPSSLRLSPIELSCLDTSYVLYIPSKFVL